MRHKNVKSCLIHNRYYEKATPPKKDERLLGVPIPPFSETLVLYIRIYVEKTHMNS